MCKENNIKSYRGQSIFGREVHDWMVAFGTDGCPDEIRPRETKDKKVSRGKLRSSWPCPS